MLILIFHHEILIDECFCDLHVPATSRMTYHVLRHPEVEETNLSHDILINIKQEFLPRQAVHQVVSLFAATNHTDYQFYYGSLSNKTCMWINHEPNELPQLLIFYAHSIEYESNLIKIYLSEYKDKPTKLHTMTYALLLPNILRNHIKLCVCLCFLSLVYSNVFYVHNYFVLGFLLVFPLRFRLGLLWFFGGETVPCFVIDCVQSAAKGCMHLMICPFL